MSTANKISFIIFGFLCICNFSFNSGCSGNNSDPLTPRPDWIIEPHDNVCTSLDQVDTNNPDHVIGTGTPESVTEDALRTAMESGGTIIFNTGNSPVTITITSPLMIPDLTDVILDGGGLVTLDGDNSSALIDKAWQCRLTVQGVDFINARAEESGAAINSSSDWDGSLTVINCNFDNCKTTQTGPDTGGGAIRALGQTHTQISNSVFNNCAGSNGGAINSLGSQLTIINCTFTGNSAFGLKGGAEVLPSGTGQGGIGGAVYIDGVHLNADEPQLTISCCVFDGNSANEFGGGVFAHTYRGSNSIVTVHATTFHNNTVQDPDALSGHGGAMYIGNSATTITNSTFSNNKTAAGLGGGIFLITNLGAMMANCTFDNNSANLGGAMDIEATAYLSNLTIADNWANIFGGGIRSTPNPDIRIKNSLFLNNAAGDEWNGHAVSNTLKDGGGNIQWPQQRIGFTENDTPVTDSVIFVDSHLSPLADNGGPTETMALPEGSPAIDAGTDSDCPLTDQRGKDRYGTCDAGSYERQDMEVSVR